MGYLVNVVESDGASVLWALTPKLPAPGSA